MSLIVLLVRGRVGRTGKSGKVGSKDLGGGTDIYM